MSKVASGDERGLGESKGRALAFVLLLITLLGCGSGSGDQAYAEGFKVSMEAFRDTAIEIETRPLPATEGLNREQKLKQLAQRMREDARAWQKCADRFKSLSPSPQFEELNRRSIALLEQMGEDQSRFADSVVTGSPDMNRFKSDFDKHMITNLRRLSQEVDRIGGTEADRLKASLKEIEEMASKG